MSNWLRSKLKMGAEEAIDLGEGEVLVHYIGRHWIMLLAGMVLPTLALLLLGGLAFYRAVGGTFLVVEAAQPGWDLVNILLVGLVGLLGLVWLLLFTRGKKTQRTRAVLLGVGAGLGLLFYYRFNGGRIFSIDPSNSGQQADAFNLLLYLLMAIVVFRIFLIGYDWLNDELILTNQRVVYDNDQVFIPRLLEQRVQEQIFLVEVQGVVAKTESYLQYYLDYGTITIKSARFGGNIVFNAAAGAKDMQNAINGQMKKLQKSMTTAEYDRLIQDRVYGNKQSQGKFARKTVETRGLPVLRWLFLDNPSFNENDGTYTWRPHWLFLMRALIGPTLLLTIGLFSVALGASLGLDAAMTTILALVVLIASALWAAWEYEDYRNDSYIVTPTMVKDIDKKPFGPENSLTGQIVQLTNVRYETTFVSNLLGYGDVYLETAGGGQKFTFNHVPRPSEVVGVINEYMVGVKLREKARTLEDTADLISRYHEAQLRHNELNLPPSAAD